MTLYTLQKNPVHLCTCLQSLRGVLEVESQEKRTF